MQVARRNRFEFNRSRHPSAPFHPPTPPLRRHRLDGVNTLRLKLSVLRSAITCIPQDPVLFSGTVRHNLDPAGASSHSDYDLWQALEAVQLKRHIGGEGQGLDSSVAEYGENFSAGCGAQDTRAPE